MFSLLKQILVTVGKRVRHATAMFIIQDQTTADYKTYVSGECGSITEQIQFGKAEQT